MSSKKSGHDAKNDDDDDDDDEIDDNDDRVYEVVSVK